jgi:hypothetical protein
MTTEPTTNPIPIACDMTDAPDTAEERMAEYGRLFAQALTGREWTDEGVRLRFRADDGIEAWIRDLSVREKACCPFFDFAISTTNGEVRWDISVVANVADEQLARTLLDEYFSAPDTVGAGVAGMQARFNERGLPITTNASGTVMQFNRVSQEP